VADLLEREHQRVSDHTNFQMAALSLTGAVRQLAEILGQVPPGAASGADDDLRPAEG
jgi:hypothetical protein